MKHLVLGGARSGKSQFSERLARQWLKEQPEKEKASSDAQLVYAATATIDDEEMEQRIEHHKARRSEQWLLVEEPVKLANVLREYSPSNYCILVECLTLWLSNCLHQNCWEQQRDEFLQVFNATDATIILVGNEVGLGVVPMGQLSRVFVDESGRLHQSLAPLCDKVSFLVSGRP